MSLKMIKTIANAVSITGLAVGAAIKMNETPFLGGGGSGGVNGGLRNAVLNLAAAVGGAGVVKIQGHDGVDTPASGDSGWYDIASLTSASPLRQEIQIARWIRTNVTTIGTGTVTIILEGVQ